MDHSKWEERFEELKDYRKKYGNCLVSKNYQQNKKLARWVSWQRVQCKKFQKGEHAFITKERISKLKSIDFVWEVGNAVIFPANDEKWESRFEELKDYRKKYGNCLVPAKYQDNKQLGNWVNTQRKEHRKFQKGEDSQITKERISKLESINFVWEVGTGHVVEGGLRNDEFWEKRFDELKDYRKKYGNCLVPKIYQQNKQLGYWVHKQRTQYKKFQNGDKSSITKERISKLKSIGFAWESPPGPRKRVKTPTAVEAQKESHTRQTQVATKGRGRKRKEITENSPQSVSNSKRQKSGLETSSSSSQESSLNKQKKEKKGRIRKRPATSQRRSTPTPDSPPSSSEIQMPIPDAAPSSSPTSWKPQGRSNPSPNAAASKKYINSRVAKEFYVEESGKEKKTDIFFGTVDRLRLSHDDTPLWHVQYDDGDEEEFLGDELVRAMKFYKRNRDNDPQVIAFTKKVKAEQTI